MLQLAKEVAILRRTFKRALTLTISENDGDRQKRSNDINPKLKKFDPKLAFDLADQMKDLDEESIRKIRSGMYVEINSTYLIFHLFNNIN